ncbi:tetratricopeptide repeat-containing diguanylate cyclase [Lachnospiraceae bacterium KK002]
MDFTNYGKEIQAQIEEMMELRYKRGEPYMESCRRLVDVGKEKNDSYLLGFAYYYLAESYLCLNDHQNLMICLAESIVNQQKASQWDLLIRSHNVMGVDAFNRGNTTVALDQYITALSYGEKYDFPYETALVTCNIGRLYMGFGEFDSAVRYLKKAQDIFSDYKQEFFGRGNLANTYASLGRCSLFQKNLEEAAEYEEKIREIGEMDETGIDFFMTQGLIVRIRHVQGRFAERDQYIENIIQKLENLQIIMDSHEDVFDFLDFLLEIGKFKELERIFPGLELLVKETGITNLQMELLRRQAEYYRDTGQRERYLEVCASLYEDGKILKEENVGVIHRSTELRFSLKEARLKEEALLKEKKELQERSEKDELTGLPNRYKLNDFAGKIFDRASENQERLSIEIFDVDFFKQYNDAYGHQAGDTCLQQIGEILKELMKRDSNIFCARYGGDEFIIIYYGKTDEEILALAKELRERISGLKIEHKGSQVSEYVTVSQGIRNSVPTHQNRMWDYLYAADGALYNVKRKQKNSICLIHRNEDNAESVIL